MNTIEFHFIKNSGIASVLIQILKLSCNRVEITIDFLIIMILSSEIDTRVEMAFW